MDLTNYVLGKDIIKNPKYDKRTKAGRAQPEFIVNNDINHVDDSVDNILELKEQNDWNGSWSADERKNFQKYGVVENKIDSDEEYRKLRAKNQSGFEQMGRSFAQIAVNEVLLGSILGLSDLIDVIANHGKELGEDDYTNPVSSFLTDIQDRVKERFEIYRENPGKPLDFKDAGWFWDNFVNVGSTASLLIPSMGVAKGLGLIGKGAKALTKGTKFDRSLYRASRWMAKTAGSKHPDTIVRGLEKFKDVAIPSVISRQMEDMLEARETYNDVYDESINKLNELYKPGNEKKLEEFFEKNEMFVNEDGTRWDNNKIARYIADKAATYTFVNDFKYIGYDFLQFSNILRFGSKPITRALNTTQKGVLKQMANGSEKAAEELLEKGGRLGQINDFLKFYAKNPKIAIKNAAENVALTEGFEEIGQGITQENAKGEYERIFNPNYTDRTLASQLSDPQIWEQGLWGMIGGVVFKGVGKGGKYVYNQYQRAKHKNDWTEEDIKRAEANEESYREDEINGRLNAALIFEAKLNLWKHGYNPQQTILDSNGKEIKTDYSDESNFEKMTDDEKELIFDNIVNEYLINMVTSAVDVGNGDLLQAFIESEEFSRYIDRIGGNDEYTQNLKNKMLKRYDDIKNSYYKNLREVFGSLDIQSEYLGKAIATNMTRNEMHIKDLNEEIANTKNKILSTVEEVRYDNYRRRKMIDDVNLSIGETLQEMKENKEKYNKKEINKTQYNAREKELQKRLDEYYKIGDIKDQYEQAYKKALNDLKNEGFENADKIGKEFTELSNSEKDILLKENEEFGEVPNVVKDLIDKQVKMEINLAWTKSQLIESQEELEDAYNDILAAHEEIIDNRFKYARSKVLDYINNSLNPSEAFNNLMENTAPKNIQEQFDLFKLGDENYAIHEALFRDAAENKQRLTNAAEVTEESKELDELSKKEIIEEEKTEEEIEEKEIEEKENNISPVKGMPNKNNDNQDEEGNKIQEGDVSPETIIDEEITPNAGDIPPYDYKFMQFLLDYEIQSYHDAYEILFNLTSEEKIDLRDLKLEGKTYEKIYNELYNLIKNKNISDEYKLTDKEIESITNGALAKVIEDIASNVDLNTKKKYLNLSKALREKKNIYSNIGDNATKEEIEKYNKTCEELINSALSYLDGNILKHNDRIIIDIDILFSKLYSIYGEETLQLVNPILNYLREDLKSGHQKYEISDSKKIAAYLNKPNELLQYIKSANYEKLISDDYYGSYMHIQLERAAYRGLKRVEDLKQGINVMEAKMSYDETGAYKIIYDGYKEQIIDKREENVIKDLEAFSNYIKLHNILKTNKNAKLIPFKFGNSIVYRVYDGSISMKELKDEETGKKWTLGFISTVNASKDNNTFSRPILDNSYGLFFEATRDSSGKVTTNFDDIFLDILNAKGRGKDILNYLNNKKDKFTKEELKIIEEYFDLKNNKNIKLHDYDKTKGLTNKQAKELLYGYIYNWLIFAPIRLQAENFIESYYRYTEKLYSNYAMTYDLQTKLDKDHNSGEFTYAIPSLPNDMIETDIESYNIDNKLFNKPIEQITYIDKDGLIHIAGSNTTYENDDNMFEGRFGIVLKDNFNDSGKPAIAWINYKNPLSSNKELYNALKNHIKDLIRNVYSKSGITKKKNGLIVLTEELDKLIGKESIFYREKNSELANAIFEIKGHGYDYLEETGENGKSIIDNLVDAFLEGVNINLSVALAKGTLSEKSDVISVENGAITVKVGDKVFKYDNFADFVLSVGTFKTNQRIVSRFDGFNDNENTIMVSNVKYEKIEIDENEIIGTYNATVQLLEKSKKDDLIDVEKLLLTAGILQEDIDILLGKNSGISVVDKNVKYDKTTEGIPETAKAYYNSKDDNIYLTKHYVTPPTDKKASTEYKGSRYKNELIRLLIHENIHKNFNKLSEEEKKYVTNELAKIYIAFGEALNEDSETNEKAKIIIESFKGSEFDLQEILNNSNDIKNNTISNDKLRYLMNEFLSETLSRANVIEYLNSKNYKGDEINIDLEDSKKETLWEKICRLIMNFFNSVYKGFNVTNYADKSNNSIFANEYRLLSAIGNIKTEEKTSNENNIQEEDKTLPKPKKKRTAKKKTSKTNEKSTKNEEQLTINFEEDITENIETKTEDTEDNRNFDNDDVTYENDSNNNNIDINDIELSSTGMDATEYEVRLSVSNRNGDIDNSGVIRANSMADFARRFGVNEVAKFSSMIENGTFTYTCK